ncbi:hypothetical protein ACFFSW_05205 [Saccharothrix longispora]|uniref:Transferase n=1 Tax=Saccharothrix longispora TaxID=33920 RepID=A0ABU1PSG8_9PSEU|nr:hypothetical protein [Saccharothrix longispora]MDR6593218.1 hypothetical protein [Saccharothrix longispora]
MLRTSRLVTALAVAIAYVAAHLLTTAGLDLRDRERFADAPARAAVFADAVRGCAAGVPGSCDGVRAGDAWFRDNAPPFGSRTLVSLAADGAGDGRDTAVLYLDDLAEEVAADRVALDAALDGSADRALWWTGIAALLAGAALWLRRRRREAAADVVELVSRYVPHRPRWRRPVFLALTGVGYVLLVGGFLGGTLSLRVEGLPWGARSWVLVGAVVAVALASPVLRHSRRRSARDAVRALEADGRRPVLYLRAFVDDHTSAAVDNVTVGLSGFLLPVHSREEQLASVLRAFGPVIAVGRPGEPLPHLGAARFYLPPDDWRPGVLRLMELSRLVVLRLGPGEGLWWELERARATQPPDKLVLLVPGDRDDLHRRLDGHLPTPARLDLLVPSSADRWTAAVVAFDADWAPHVSPVVPAGSPPGSPAHHVARALRAALESVGVRRRGLVTRVNTGMLVAFGKVLLLLPVAVLVLRLIELADPR